MYSCKTDENIALIVKRFLTACVLVLALVLQYSIAEDKPEGEKKAVEEVTGVMKLSLEDSESLAIMNSEAMKQVIENREVAKGRIWSAYGQALPQVNARVGKYFSGTYANGLAGDERDRFNKQYSGTLMLSQPIYSGGKVMAALRGAKLYRQSVELGIDSTRQEIIYAVRVTYNRILFYRENVKVSSEQVKLAQNYLGDVKKRIDVGDAVAYDVLRAEVELTNEQTALTSNANELDKAMTDFSVLLGLPENTSFDLTGKLDYDKHSPEDTNELYKLALSMRPDVKSSELQVKMQKEAIQLVRAELFPQLSLSADYTRSNVELGGSVHEWEKDWNVGIVMDWSIFDGLLIRGQVREERAKKKQLELADKDLKDRVYSQIKNALLDIKTAIKNVVAQEHNVKQATESLRLTQEREKHGVATHLDVLTARQTLAVTKRNYFQAIFSYKVAWADLALAIGNIDKNMGNDTTASVNADANAEIK